MARMRFCKNNRMTPCHEFINMMAGGCLQQCCGPAAPQAAPWTHVFAQKRKNSEPYHLGIWRVSAFMSRSGASIFSHCGLSMFVASCHEGASKGQPTENCAGNFRLPLRPFIHRISLLRGALSMWDDLPSKISNNITSLHGTSDLRSFEGTTAVAVTRVTRIHSVTPHAQRSLLLRGIPLQLAGLVYSPACWVSGPSSNIRRQESFAAARSDLACKSCFLHNMNAEVKSRCDAGASATKSHV